jgi:gamma-glutamyltranspeptidase/glutathione hydrolase
MTGVPGEVAGLMELHKRWGKLPFGDDVRAAAAVAANGFPVSAHMARTLKWNAKWLATEKRYAMWAPGGALLEANAIVKNAPLAATLGRLAAEGKAAFYQGVIAADILATARSGGSRMKQQDLDGYQVIERAPLTSRWEGYEIATMPPPSAGGLLLLETLGTHSKADLAALGYGTGAYDHLLAETFRAAFSDRYRTIGDPAYVKIDTAALLAPARLAARKKRYKADATTPAEAFPLHESGTSHLVVIDGEGNVVSITSTVNNMFGAKLATDSGFVLNDELADFSQADVAKRFLGNANDPNAPRGGARPTSSMTPTIVLQDGAPVLALGGSGGPKITGNVTQVLLANLVFGRSPADAVTDVRLFASPTGGLQLDPGASPELVADLVKRGEVVDASQVNFSGVQCVSVTTKDGVRTLLGGADPRKFGSALVE